MDIKEFEDNLTDLESRVDRLRALYENWFRGYEKLEPSIARKDCERRVYALRKELPRNTALRFRYNMLFQRYTTLAQYWQRTAKQIEEGTYRLQLRRMRRKNDDGETRSKRRARESGAPAPSGYELDLNESLDVSDLLDEHEMDAVAQAVDKPKPFADPPDTSTMRATGTFGRPQDSLQASRTNAGAPVGRVNDAARPGFGSAPATGTQRLPESPAAARALPGSTDPARAPLAPQQTNVGIGGLPGMPGLKPPPRAGVPVPPPPANLNGVRPPVAPAGAARPPLPAAGKPPPPPLPGRPNPATTPRAPEPAGGLSDQRLRRLYDEYASARRNNNEGEVRYESLVRSIEKMLPELHKKHAGKQIDFDVVVKDGRVGLKPRAK